VLVGTWDRPDPYLRTFARSLRWLAEVAPSERAFLEAFCLWLYTPRAYEDGTVDKFIEETLAFPHKPSAEAMQRGLDAFAAHDTTGRLASIRVPTLVLAGGQDIITPPHFGRLVAGAIPRARLEILIGEAHQPFQEAPELFNEEVDAFWREVEASEQTAGGAPRSASAIHGALDGR
jgi:pimeloyl-ACP methyl ester carboxylesterase